MYKEILRNSLRDIFENYQVLLKALLIPTILLLGLDIVGKVFIDEDSNALDITIGVISLFIDVIIAVIVHRLLLLGKDAIPEWGVNGFTSREWKFLGKYILMTLLFVLLMALVALVLIPLELSRGMHIVFSFIVSFMISLPLLSRFSLVFPATALDVKMSFKDSWNITSEYKWLIFVATVLYPIGFALLIGGIYGMIIQLLTWLISPNVEILMVFLHVIISVFLISALSNSYKFILNEIDWRGEIDTEDSSEPKATQIIEDGDKFKAIFDRYGGVSYEQLKEMVKEQYIPLGFENRAIEKEFSFMLKHPEQMMSYILLKADEDNWILEVFNAPKPMYIAQLESQM